MLGIPMHREKFMGIWGPKEKAAICKPKTCISGETISCWYPSLRILASGTAPVCGIFLWKPQQTNIVCDHKK